MSSPKRRDFQYVQGTSKKFWNITLDDRKYIVHFGRIGTAGLMQIKEFKSPDSAKQSYNNIINEKMRKGYKEVFGSTTGVMLPLSYEAEPESVSTVRRVVIKGKKKEKSDGEAGNTGL